MFQDLAQSKFKIQSKFSPSGDQPHAIELLTQGLNNGAKDQVLLGVTRFLLDFTRFLLVNLVKNLVKPSKT